MFQYDEAQEFGVLKGVDIHYDAVCSIHDAILEGSFEIEKDQLIGQFGFRYLK